MEMPENAAESDGKIDDTPLREAMERQGLTLPRKKTRLLCQYCLLLWEWNEKLNLTRHTDFDKFVARDLVDSMRLAELLRPGEHVLDVGTGGGVPGVPLAILRPDLNVELCDSTGKKATALADILDRMRLKIPVWNAKAEHLLKVHRFTTLVIRAVARMPKLLDWFAPHWHTFDRLLLIKGPAWVAERGESRHYNKLSKLSLRKLLSYPIPGSEQESVILQICMREKFETLDQVIDGHIEAASMLAVANKGQSSGQGKPDRPRPAKKQPLRRKGDVKTRGDVKRELAAKEQQKKTGKKIAKRSDRSPRRPSR